MTDDEPLVPRFMPAHDPGEFIVQITRPISVFRRPDVVLVAWGDSAEKAALAYVRGGKYAEDFGYTVVTTVTTVTAYMRDAELFATTVTGFVRREIVDGAAWWLVLRSAVRDHELKAAEARPDVEDTAYANTFKREYGYAPGDMTLAHEADSRPLSKYPFTDVPKVEDAQTHRFVNTQTLRGRPMPDRMTEQLSADERIKRARQRYETSRTAAFALLDTVRAPATQRSDQNDTEE